MGNDTGHLLKSEKRLGHVFYISKTRRNFAATPLIFFIYLKFIIKKHEHFCIKSVERI